MSKNKSQGKATPAAMPAEGAKPDAPPAGDTPPATDAPPATDIAPPAADTAPATRKRKPRVLAEAKRDGKTVRVLTDDVRVWKEID